MTDKQIGNLVKEIRKEKNIGIEMVTRGLCSSATLSYFEKGQRKLDNLQMYHIFDRIGIEVDKFAFMVDENQYKYHLWKKETFEAIEKQDWDTLEILLRNKKRVFEKTYSKKIQYQYYYKLNAILEAEKYHNYKKATFFLRKSIEQTMPTVLMIQWDKLCLGEQELHILMLYLYYGTRAEYFDKEEQKELYRKLANYINIEHLEDKKLARIYPKLVCIWMHITQLPLLERKKLCEDAIRILQETRRLHDIVEVLRFYVEILENEKSEKEVYYRKHYENFKDILENAGIECRFRPELLVGSREKLFLITEYLRSVRMMKGMTQQEVCFGICEPETYSRIETGKHVPVKSNMYQLAERLGISWCFYRGEIEIGSLQTYQMYQLVKKYSNRGLREEGMYWLKQLEQLLDMSSLVNVQYVEFQKIIVERKLGRIDLEQAYRRLEEVLEMTTTLPIDNQFRYYSQMELEIICEMGKTLHQQKKYEEGRLLLESIIENQRKSKMIWAFQWNGIDFVLRVLSDLYFGMQRYEEANDIVNYVMKTNLKQRVAIFLPHLLDCMADNYEHLGVQYSNQYKKLYCQTCYVADFFKFENIYSFAKKYYEEKFDKEMKWY